MHVKLTLWVLLLVILSSRCSDGASTGHEISGVSIREEQKEPVAKALSENNIQYEILNMEGGGYVIKWDPKETKPALGVITSVMRENQW